MTNISTLTTHLFLLTCVSVLLSPAVAMADIVSPPLQYPIVFVAQMPPMQGYASLNDAFTNHLAGPDSAPRGSDLYILYPDGSLKNLTASAGWA